MYVSESVHRSMAIASRTNLAEGTSKCCELLLVGVVKRNSANRRCGGSWESVGIYAHAYHFSLQVALGQQLARKLVPGQQSHS